MSVSIENTSHLGRRLTVSVPAETILKDVESKLKKTAAKAHLKGFRPGKAPLKLIKETYEEGLRLDAMQEQVNQSLQAALKEHELTPAGMPKIHLKNTDLNQAFEYTAEFEVFPQIELKTLQGESIEKVVAEISDAEVEDTLQAILKQHVFFEKVDRAAALEDKVVIDFEGKMDGEALENGSAKDATLVLGAKQFIDGFEDGLVGAKAGEARHLSLHFPEKYHVEKLAGKAVEFDVTIKEVMAPHLPEMTAEFLKVFHIEDGKPETFRAEIRKNMAREVQHKTKNLVKQNVFNKLHDIHDFELPEALIDAEIEQLQKQTAQEMQRMYNIKSAPPMPKELFTERARYRVKLGLLLDELHKQFKPEAKPERIQSIVEEIASSYADGEQAKKWLLSNPERMKEINMLAIEDELIEQLLKEATVLEKTQSYTSLMKQPAHGQAGHVHDEHCNHDHDDHAH